MKPSDSTNSLTALTEVVPEIDCFICLEPGSNDLGEPLVDSMLLRTCGCKFRVHPACWNEWMKGKDDWDCPICRRESINVPVPPIPVHMQRPLPDMYSGSWKFFAVFVVVSILLGVSIWAITMRLLH